MSKDTWINQINNIARARGYTFYKSIVIKSKFVGDFVVYIHKSHVGGNYYYNYWNANYNIVYGVNCKTPREAINKVRARIKKYIKEVII